MQEVIACRNVHVLNALVFKTNIYIIKITLFSTGFKMPVDKESYTRIFIMGGRSGEGCDKDDYRAVFGKFGNVADIFMATDRQTRRENGASQI